MAEDDQSGPHHEVSYLKKPKNQVTVTSFNCRELGKYIQPDTHVS